MDRDRTRIDRACGRIASVACRRPGSSSQNWRGNIEAAKGSPIKLAPLFNTRLGLPFESDVGEGADAEAVREMAEAYPGDRCPPEAALITAGVDVQAGWIAVSIVAWGDGDEAAALAMARDTGRGARSENLGEGRGGARADIPASLGCGVADRGGGDRCGLRDAERFTSSRRSIERGASAGIATKGVAGSGRPLWKRGGDIIAVDGAVLHRRRRSSARQQVLSGLAQAEAGPGKIHTRADFPEHWWMWATSEEQVQRETSGGVKVEWRMKKGQRRNEVLDTITLALAVRYSADFDIPARLERMETTGSVKPAQSSMAELG